VENIAQKKHYLFGFIARYKLIPSDYHSSWLYFFQKYILLNRHLMFYLFSLIWHQLFHLEYKERQKKLSFTAQNPKGREWLFKYLTYPLFKLVHILHHFCF
jgi:hypothetical protein